MLIAKSPSKSPWLLFLKIKVGKENKNEKRKMKNKLRMGI